MNTLDQKDQYAKAVSMFLAELLRTRRIGLNRAADIAQKVVANLNLLDSEARFLQFIKELSGDFEELFQLEARVDMHMKFSARHDFEQKVREFAISTLPTDANLACLVLQEAVSENCESEELSAKFPQFKEFINSKV